MAPLWRIVMCTCIAFVMQAAQIRASATTPSERRVALHSAPHESTVRYIWVL
jgi:hypothetical protein